MSDEVPSTSISVLVTLSSPDRMSLLTFYFPKETDEYGTFVEVANTIDGAISCDEYSDEMLMVDMSQIINDVHLETADYYPKSAILRL